MFSVCISVGFSFSISCYFFQIFDQTLFTFNKGLGAGRTPMSYDCSILMSRVVFLGSHCWWSVQACSLGLPESPEGDTFRVHPRRECAGTTSLLWENVYSLRMQCASGVGSLHLCSGTRDRFFSQMKILKSSPRIEKWLGPQLWSVRVDSAGTPALWASLPSFYPSFVLKYLKMQLSSHPVSQVKSPERAPRPQPFQQPAPGSWQILKSAFATTNNAS